MALSKFIKNNKLINYYFDISFKQSVNEVYKFCSHKWQSPKSR